MQGPGRRVGLLGGSFDPPHEGHLWMARLARREAELDEVWLLPAVDPPHKEAGRLSPYADRLAMVRLLAAEEPFLEVCRIEESLPRPGYSYRTLLALRERHPEHRFFFILGADTLEALEGWREPEILLREAELLVLAREGHAAATGRPAIVLAGGTHPAQSRRIRTRLAAGGEPEHLTGPVRDYIRRRGLYREGGPS